MGYRVCFSELDIGWCCAVYFLALVSLVIGVFTVTKK